MKKCEKKTKSINIPNSKTIFNKYSWKLINKNPKKIKFVENKINFKKYY